jgi:hypothetical protein
LVAEVAQKTPNDGLPVVRIEGGQGLKSARQHLVRHKLRDGQELRKLPARAIIVG